MRKLLSTLTVVATVVASLFVLAPGAAQARDASPATESWTITITDSTGAPVSIGTYDWRSTDNTTQSTSVTATTDGVATFLRTPPTGKDVNLTVSGALLSNGHSVTGRWLIPANQTSSAVTVVVPAEPSVTSYTVKVTADDNKPATAASANPVVPGVGVYTNLSNTATVAGSDNSVARLYDFRYGLGLEQLTSDVTDGSGQVTFVGYTPTQPVTAYVRYTDSTGDRATTPSSLTANATTTLTLPAYTYLSGPAAVTTVASPKTLTTWNVKVNTVGVAPTTVTLTGPHHSTLTCTGAVLTATVTANGTAVLKACPSMSGIYTFSAPGVVSTTTLVKVTGTAPLAVTGLSASAPTTNTARLTWTAPAFNGGSAVTGYTVEAWTSITGAGTVTQNFTLSTTATTVDLNGFAGGYVWYFLVSAKNAKGISSSTLTKTLVTGSSDIAPIMRSAPSIPLPLMSDGTSFRTSVGDWVANPNPVYNTTFFWCTVATVAGTTLDNRCTEIPNELATGSLSTGRDFMVHTQDIGKYLVFGVQAQNTAGTSSWQYTAGVRVNGPVTAPTLSGAIKVGSVVSIVKGGTYASKTWKPQWRLDGELIEGATAMTYRPVAGDMGHMLSASVVFEGTGQAIPPYSLIGERLVAAGTLASTPVPTLPTTVRVAQSVTVTPGTWDPGTELTYAWAVDGVTVNGEDQPSFSVPASAYNKRLTVAITGTKTGYASVTKTSVARTVTAATMTLQPTPVITGTPKFGQTLGITIGTWDAGVSLAYQWKRGGVAIASATSSQYTLTTADVTKLITVSVTATKLGYATVTKTSAAVTGALADFETSPVPTVAGTTRVGQVLQATVGDWPAGTTLSYKWMRGTTAIAGATGTSYTLTAADNATSVKFVVSASKTGYASLVRESSAMPIQAGLLTLTPETTFAATPAFGSAAAAAASTWDTGVTKTYVWKLNGTVIAGATAATYTPTQANIGQTLQLIVTGTKAGYESVSKASPATTITKASFATPTFRWPSGLTKYLYEGQFGYCRSANISWTISNPSGATLSYQWYRIPVGESTGVAIAHATNAEYQMDETEPGAQFYLEATFIKAGYFTQTFTSTAAAAAAACPGGR